MNVEGHDPTESGWSRDALLSAVDGDEQLAAEFIGVFLTEHAHLVAAVREALGGADRTALTRAAHSLKGALASFTSIGARITAGELELLGRSGEIESAGVLVDLLERQVAALVRDMTADPLVSTTTSA